jgi:hypothetical protein
MLAIAFTIPFFALVVGQFATERRIRQWCQLGAALYIVIYVAVFGDCLKAIH